MNSHIASYCLMATALHSDSGYPVTLGLGQSAHQIAISVNYLVSSTIDSLHFALAVPVAWGDIRTD